MSDTNPWNNPLPARIIVSKCRSAPYIAGSAITSDAQGDNCTFASAELNSDLCSKPNRAGATSASDAQKTSHASPPMDPHGFDGRTRRGAFRFVQAGREPSPRCVLAASHLLERLGIGEQRLIHD